MSLGPLQWISPQHPFRLQLQCWVLDQSWVQHCIDANDHGSDSRKKLVEALLDLGV